jgi:hypothetical protein
MHVLEPDMEAGRCPGNGLHLYCLTKFVRVLYPGYRMPPVMAQQNLDTTRLPPVANDWRAMYPILDMVPPLLAKREGPST